jgi:hypothetical protein
MSTVQSHPHKFRDSEWPFAVPQNALAIATKPVIEMGYPVLLVSHDDDGIWQVLCDTTTEADDCLVVCLGCCFERDATIGDLANLPPGWIAQRESVGGPWSRRQAPSEDGNEA